MDRVILIFHIVFGAVALLTGPLAMMNQTGNNIHRISGKLFFWSMTVVFVSAVYLSLAHDKLFLLLIAVFSYHHLAIGYRALYLKKLDQQHRAGTLDWTITIVTLIFNSCLLLWGMQVIIVLNDSFGIIAIVFSGIGLLNNKRDIGIYRNGYKDKNGWLYIHIGGMMGGYIAALTAFLVNVVHLEPAWLLWLTPTILLVPVIVLTMRKFNKKFASGKSAKEVVTMKIKQDEKV